ncbi:MAG: right-handed parallel beta-helix repeat-containing protein, partial [Sedimentisphaerales bacterium]|nr:right-handed parallel beta-helix repeat-containing protein [Sedimentisphaerales bacterium]
DYVTVFVGNETPIADAGPDMVVNIPCTVTLDGTFSYDYDLNDVLTYTWFQTEGPTVSLQYPGTANPSFYCDQEGIYKFTLIVNDGLDTSEQDTMEIKTASVSANQQIIDFGYEISDYFYYPALSGDKLVYCYGTESDYTWDIYYDNLTTGTLYSFAAGGVDTQPKIDGDIVVWFGGMNWNEPWSNEPRNSCVIARNLVTGVQKTIKGYSMSSSCSHPAISDKKVVWIEHHNLDTAPIGSNSAENWWNTTYSICGADVGNLNSPSYFTIAPNVGTRDPYSVQNFAGDFDDVIDIDGDIVVYEANGDIYGADISDIDNIKVFTIFSGPSRQYDPAISGNIVVWTDQLQDLGDICGADISDMNNIRCFSLVRAAGIQQQPDIDGRFMVYVDGDTECGDIKASFISGQCAIDIPLTGSLYGSGPVIDGTVIVWQTSTHEQLESLSLEFLYSTIDGPIENTTTGKKYDYIQHAIDDSNDGDTIIVAPGLYCENIDTHGKNLIISSTDPNDPAIVESTVLTAMNNDYAAVTYSDGQDVNCVLEGFTITGSEIGIYCEEFSSPTISMCDISGNSQYGIYLYRGCEPLISECTIMNNSDSGIKMRTPNETIMYYNMPVITNCVISGNGMFGISGGKPTIINCTIADNTICGLYNLEAAVTNSIIYFNGDGSLFGQIMGDQSTITYCDIQGTWLGAGNIDSDPLFADSLNGDYHLKSEAGRWDAISMTWVQDSSSSPCIDAGDPGSFIGLEPSPNGFVINMGAYGGTDVASMSQ